jgi:hypothetical protein
LLECGMLSGSLQTVCMDWVKMYAHLGWLRQHVAKIEKVLMSADGTTSPDAGATPDQFSSPAAPVYDAKLPAIDLSGASFQWPAAPPSGGDSPTQRSFKGLVDLDVTIGRGEVVIVSGNVSSGKTTFLESLIGSTECVAGKVVLNARDGKIAYSEQAPSFLNSTIKDVSIGYPLASFATEFWLSLLSLSHSTDSHLFLAAYLISPGACCRMWFSVMRMLTHTHCKWRCRARN